MIQGAGRKVFFAAVLSVALGLVAWGLMPRQTASPVDARQKAAALSPLARESVSLLGPSLRGVYLGMTQPELQRARPRCVRQKRADEPAYLMLEEALPSNERVLYGIDSTSLTLAKVQIAGKLEAVDAVEGRVATMQGRYGPPTGVFDCPMVPGQLPTRRFTYQRSALGVMDSYLLIGDQVAVTLYVAPLRVLRASLTMAQCAPTPADRLARFPAVPLPAK